MLGLSPPVLDQFQGYYIHSARAVEGKEEATFMAVSAQLDKPVKVFFIVGNSLVWISFCAAVIFHWREMSSWSHWASIALAGSFLLLGRSLLFKDEDKSSRLMYATAAFLATMISVSRSLF